MTGRYHIFMYYVLLLFSVVFFSCSSQHPDEQTTSQNWAMGAVISSPSVPDELAMTLVTPGSDAFASTLHPLLLENCASCHSRSVPITLRRLPYLAEADPELALTEITSANVVDLLTPVDSRLVTKLSVDSHNCWTTNCENDANNLLGAIGEWATLVNTGQSAYVQMCANCHGLEGQGTPDNIGLTRQIPIGELTTFIDANMPKNNPTSCTGTCASDMANFIFNNFVKVENVVSSEPLADFPTGAEQQAMLCSRLANLNAQNVVRDVFCGATQPGITSLRELQAALGLAFTNPNATGRDNNGRQGNPAFTLVGHSSSLVARLTTTLNPRALIFTPPTGRTLPGLVVMGFVRGDQFVEIVTSDRVTNELQFFLFTFKQACSLTHSCTPGELLTPAIESNWVEYSVYSQVDLQNTVLDCLHCHQPDGPGTRSILRMQELVEPWTHFFRDDTSGRLLLADFVAAHGTNEDYAGIPAQLISGSDPELLEDLIRDNGFANQPNEFISEVIENQVDQAPGQPRNNVPPGASLEWQRIYNNTVLGQFIAVPYHDVKITDSGKLANMTAAYQAFLSGSLAMVDLPDIRDVLLDAGLRDMGFKVMAGLNGQQIITQACTQCHNSVLDQTIARAKFNVDLSNMSDTLGGVLTGVARDAEIELAIQRLSLPPEDVKKMPPELFKTLDPDEIEVATRYFCSQMTVATSVCANVTAFTDPPAPLPPAAAPGQAGNNGDDDDD